LPSILELYRYFQLHYQNDKQRQHIRKIAHLDWTTINESMNQQGFAIIPSFLPSQNCEELIQNYDNSSLYRKTVNMARYRCDLGEYKYFNYPLPNIQEVRTAIYPHLAAIANHWFQVLKIDRQYPNSHSEFLKECHDNEQLKAIPLILKYGEGGFSTLHQDLYVDVYFPIQMVLF